MEIKLLEAEVEDIIFEGQLLETYGIKCIKRQVRFGVAGIVDILGYDTKTKRWVIVEIKRDNLCAKAYTQGMRYRNWLANYQLDKHVDRGGSMSEGLGSLPYVLLIGASLSDELRFLANAHTGEFHGDACYLVFGIEPKMTLASSYNSNEYRWAMHEESVTSKGGK